MEGGGVNGSFLSLVNGGMLGIFLWGIWCDEVGTDAFWTELERI